jgi:acyl carrier protein
MVDGDLVYRTGDLVRYRADGNVEFLGRIDHQVKLRGFRIELGEIEAVLRLHPAIVDAVVLARALAQGDEPRLVSYVIPQPSAAGTEQHDLAQLTTDLRSHLREHLPEYMVPPYFVLLDAFPLSPAGKVERSALPDPDATRARLAQVEFVPPRNETEHAIAAICADLLRVDQVGVYDNFFELGGHSLLATQLISRVRDRFAIELPLRTLFEHPTVAELAAEVEAAQTRAAAPQAPAITAVSREARRMKRSDLGNQ